MKKQRIIRRYLAICDRYYSAHNRVPPVLLQSVGRICVESDEVIQFFEILIDEYPGLVDFFISLELMSANDDDDDDESVSGPLELDSHSKAPGENRTPIETDHITRYHQ